MGTIPTRRGVTAAAVAAILWIPAPASAATSCTHDIPGAEAEVILDTDATVAVGLGNAILVNAAPCETADTSNIDTISVLGTASVANSVVVDLSGGQLAPGATPETTGTAEIEITLDLGGDGGDRLTVLGTAGDDILVAGQPGVNLNADDDVDVLPSEPGAIIIDGGSGDDIVGGDGGAAAPPARYDLDLRGSTGGDTITGGEGHDILRGGFDQDLLRGGGGNDRLEGGPDADTAAFDRAPGSVMADLHEGRAAGWGDDLLIAVEDILGSPHRDILLGDEGPNRIEGMRGRDRLTGAGGDDVILGGGARDFIKPGFGDDAVFGGRGVDTFTLRSAPGKVRINLQRGWAQGEGSDKVRACEKGVGGPLGDVIRGSMRNNHRLIGGPGADRIFGLDGNDRLRGGPGGDLLRGGPGDDDLKGGGGADDLKGGGGGDRLAGGAGKDLCRPDRDDTSGHCEL